MISDESCVEETLLHLTQQALPLSRARAITTHVVVLARYRISDVGCRGILQLFYPLFDWSARRHPNQCRRSGYYGSGDLEYCAWQHVTSNCLQYYP